MTVTCPNCAGALVASSGGSSADTPPLHCIACSRLFWRAEVTPSAKAKWRADYQDFGVVSPFEDAINTERGAK